MTNKLTIAIVKAELQSIGITFRKTDSNEYRVAFAEDGRDSERCAAYVYADGHAARASQSTLDDCLSQGLAMRLRRDETAARA